MRDEGICCTLVPPVLFFRYHIYYFLVNYKTMVYRRNKGYRRFSSTSHWQNGGVSAIFNFCAFLSAECVPHSAFFNNLASVETHRLRYCKIELFVQFIRHFANAFPVSGNFTKQNVEHKKI